MEENTEYLLKNKHNIELLLLNNNKLYNECLNNSSVFDNKVFIVDYSDANDILDDDCYEDGIYGFLNYQLDFKYNKLLKRKYTFQNKSSIIKKILNEDQSDFSDEGNKNNYGLLELFEKKDGSIKIMKEYYALKNANINYINDTKLNNIVIKDLSDDFKITKIYKIDSKIVLRHVMNKDEYIIESNENEQFIKYDKLVRHLCTCDKKLLDYMFNFDNIYKLRKLLNMESINDIFDINDVLDFNFIEHIDKIKIGNKYNINEYNGLIEKYFGLTINDIINDIIEKYNINIKIKSSIEMIFEIMIRIYIDIKLGNQSYNLSKNIIPYIPTDSDSGLYSHLKNQTLIDRHWRNILGYDEITIEIFDFNIKPVVQTIFQMLKKHNLNYVLQYLEAIIDKHDKVKN